MADQSNHERQSNADASAAAAAAADVDTTVEEAPTPRCPGAGFLRFLYNRRTGQILGRTPISWARILAFYIIYYGCLAGFFVGMLSVFLYGIISENKPFRTGSNSLLLLNPGLGFRPQPKMETTLIEFRVDQPATYARYLANLQNLYDTYRMMELKPNTVNIRKHCDPNSPPDREPFKVCKFNWTRYLNDCVPENNFGYSDGKPCVLLKMNRVYGWLPDPIDQNASQPMVECYGENPADRESIGAVNYFPSMEANFSGTPITLGYFNKAFFPYLKQIGYRAPLVAVKFSNLRPNTLVMVQCALRNLHNSHFSRVDREAMVRFELFMKNYTKPSTR